MGERLYSEIYIVAGGLGNLPDYDFIDTRGWGGERCTREFPIVARGSKIRDGGLRKDMKHVNISSSTPVYMVCGKYEGYMKKYMGNMWKTFSYIHMSYL